MQATVPPVGGAPGAWGAWGAWGGWGERGAGSGGGWERGRRVRLSLAELAALRDLHHLNVDWSRLRPEITLYTPNQIRHLIRFDSALTRSHSRQSLVFPTVPAAWLRDLPLPRDPAVPWRLPDLTHLQLLPGGAPTVPAGGTARGGAWEGAARALPVGALLLALLVLLVRVAEKCLDRDFFTMRRCQSEEWPTPNVLATSTMRVNDVETGPRLEDAFPPSSSDLPPPYSECTPKPLPQPHEEPPPPYSACYVTYNNPKDGVPSVHFYNRDRQELYTGGQSSDTEQISGEAVMDSNVNDTELRFDSGRIERVVDEESSANEHVIHVTSSDRYLIV